VCKGGGRSTAFSSKFKNTFWYLGGLWKTGVGKEKDFSENFRRTHPMKLKKTQVARLYRFDVFEFSWQLGVLNLTCLLKWTRSQFLKLLNRERKKNGGGVAELVRNSTYRHLVFEQFFLKLSFFFWSGHNSFALISNTREEFLLELGRLQCSIPSRFCKDCSDRRSR